MTQDSPAERHVDFLERRRKWSFFTLADESWVWRVVHPDGTERTSDASFRTLDECTADAARDGYVPYSPQRDRRQCQQFM
jgi:hypothetical protein